MVAGEVKEVEEVVVEVEVVVVDGTLRFLSSSLPGASMVTAVAEDDEDEEGAWDRMCLRFTASMWCSQVFMRGSSGLRTSGLLMSSSPLWCRLTIASRKEPVRPASRHFAEQNSLLRP